MIHKYLKEDFLKIIFNLKNLILDRKLEKYFLLKMKISINQIINELRNSLKIDNKLTFNTLSLLLIYAFNFFIGLITLPHLIKSFGTLNWGNIVFFQIIINYLIWIIDWSFNQYSTKFISINSKTQENK